MQSLSRNPQKQDQCLYQGGICPSTTWGYGKKWPSVNQHGGPLSQETNLEVFSSWSPKLQNGEEDIFIHNFWSTVFYNTECQLIDNSFKSIQETEPSVMRLFWWSKNRKRLVSYMERVPAGNRKASGKFKIIFKFEKRCFHELMLGVGGAYIIGSVREQGATGVLSAHEENHLD